MQDYTLLEHPVNTTRRLKASGVWPVASRLLRRTKQQWRRKLAKSHRPTAAGTLLDFVKTADHHLKVAKAGWDAVQGRWPPPPGTEPISSLAAYLLTVRGPGRDGVDGKRPPLFGMPPISQEAQRRFEEIGDTKSIRDDVIWVYDHLDVGNAEPIQAPTLSAWVLLGIARTDPFGFYAWIDRVLRHLESKG